MIRRVVVNEYKVAYREPMWIETLLIVSIISQMKKILERSVIHRLLRIIFIHTNCCDNSALERKKEEYLLKFLLKSTPLRVHVSDF